jgi:hypothetical protein
MFRFLIFLSFVSIIFSGCKSKSYAVQIDDSTLQSDLVHQLSNAIVYDIFSPPVASRIYAYSNLAFYEAIKYEDSSASIIQKLKGFDDIPKPENNIKFRIAAATAFYNVASALLFLKDSLLKYQAAIIDHLATNLSKKEITIAKEFGNIVAAIILKRAANDNYKLTRGMPKFSVLKDATNWQQTPPDYADAIEPNWKNITSLLPDSASQFDPVAPAVFDLNNTIRAKASHQVWTLLRITGTTTLLLQNIKVIWYLQQKKQRQVVIGWASFRLLPNKRKKILRP